jgi:hypothetical protein
VRGAAVRSTGPRSRRCAEAGRDASEFGKGRQLTVFLLLIMEWRLRLRLVTRGETLRSWHGKIALCVLGAEEVWLVLRLVT